MDNLFLWLHIGTAIFFLGPMTIAMTSAPRYIRQGDVAVVRFLHRTTRIYGMLSLLVFLFGLELGRKIFDQQWLTISMTLFVVALVLLFALVEPDQRRALAAMEANAASETAVEVPRGRIAALSNVIAVMWLVILVLMVWKPGA